MIQTTFLLAPPHHPSKEEDIDLTPKVPTTNEMKTKLRNSLFSSIKFTLFISLTSTSLSTPKSISSHNNLSRQISTQKATTLDLLSLLGPTNQSSKLDPKIAQDLWSCLKFLAPHNRTSRIINNPGGSVKGRSLSQRSENDENELIWWPPQPVLELARLCVDSGGNPDVVSWTLDPTIIHVPDVEGSTKCKCELTRFPYGRHFIHEELNDYIRFLFEMIVSRGPSVGLNVSLSRYDFFHGHLFLSKETGRLGILFHAKEYPAYEKDVFPLYMGYCQTGSDVAYDEEMNLRNILWLAPLPSSSSKDWLAPGVLVVLDANPEGIIYRDLIPDYVQIARTIYEDDFGKVAVDVNYLNVGSTSHSYQLFIC